MNEVTIVFKNGSEVTHQNASVRINHAVKMVVVETMRGTLAYKFAALDYVLRDGTLLNLTGQF